MLCQLVPTLHHGLTCPKLPYLQNLCVSTLPNGNPCHLPHYLSPPLPNPCDRALGHQHKTNKSCSSQTLENFIASWQSHTYWLQDSQTKTGTKRTWCSQATKHLQCCDRRNSACSNLHNETDVHCTMVFEERTVFQRAPCAWEASW